MLMSDSIEKAKLETGPRAKVDDNLELLPEGPARIIIEAVEKAQPGDVVYLGGFEGMELDEIQQQVLSRGITIKSDGTAIVNAVAASREGAEGNVASRTNLLEEMFIGLEGLDAADVERLKHHSSNPKGELVEWLKAQEEKAKESPSLSPRAIIAAAIERIRAQGTTTLVMRPESALAAAVVAYASGVLTSDSVDSAQFNPASPLTIQITSARSEVRSGGNMVGSADR